MAIRSLGASPSGPQDVATVEYVDQKYTKPEGGIPLADLAAAVRAAIDKADTALQSVPEATSSVTGGVRLAGDLGGTAEAPLIPALADKADLVDGKVPAVQLPSPPEVPVQSVAGRTGDVALSTEDIAGLSGALDGKSNVDHDHTANDLTGLSEEIFDLLDAKSAQEARSAIGAGTSSLTLGDTSSTAKRGDWVPSWTDVADVPSEFPPEEHDHPLAEVVGLSSALSGKADLVGGKVPEGQLPDFDGKPEGGWARSDLASAVRASLDKADSALQSVSWGTVASKPTEFPPEAHEHTIPDVTGLQDALDSKGTSNLALGTTSSTAKRGDWVPEWTDVTGRPDTFPPATHSHSADDISGLPSLLEDKADLDPSGKIPQSQIPAVALTDYLGEVSSSGAMLDLVGQRGDWCTRTDTGTDWMLIADDSSKAESWREHSYPQSPVTSVAGRTGTITLSTGDISGLSTALYGKADAEHTHLSEDIGDSTSMGRTILTTSSGSTVRGLIGAGTSDLAIGTTASTAKAGNWTPSWSEVSGKPSTFAPASHAHPLADVTGLSDALDDKADLVGGKVPESQLPDIDGKPEGGWAKADLASAVRSSLDKADSASQPGHSHAAADISDATTVGRNLVTASSQSAARSAIGAGTSNLALGTTSSTARAGNWTPSWNDVSGKPSTFTPASHTHSISDVSGLQSALDGKMAGSATAADIGGASVHSDSITFWRGTQAQYDALPSGTKNAAGFIAFIE